MDFNRIQSNSIAFDRIQSNAFELDRYFDVFLFNAIPTLFRRNSDAIPTVFRRYSDAILMLFPSTWLKYGSMNTHQSLLPQKWRADRLPPAMGPCNNNNNITSHHITSHQITSHHITSHHITSHHISHHITSHHMTSHHITSHHFTSRHITSCLLYTSPSPRDLSTSRMPSSA